MDTGLLGANVSSLAIKIVLLSKIRAMVYQKALQCPKKKGEKKSFQNNAQTRTV